MVAPLMILLAFSILEYGVVSQGKATVTAATSSAARTGATKGTRADADPQSTRRARPVSATKSMLRSSWCASTATRWAWLSRGTRTAIEIRWRQQGGVGEHGTTRGTTLPDQR